MNWQDTAKQIIDAPSRSLTEEESTRLISLHLGETRLETDADADAHFASDRGQRMFSGRAEVLGLQMPTKAVRVCMQVQGFFDTPGRIMLSLTLLKRMWATGRQPTMHDLCFTFGAGFPVDATWDAAWVAQRHPEGGNRVDTEEYWK